jgi:hypothetical protein
MKGRPLLALDAIQQLRELDLLDLVQAEFVTRWTARFARMVSSLKTATGVGYASATTGPAKRAAATTVSTLARIH